MGEAVKITAKTPEANKENKAQKTQKSESSQSISSPVDKVLFLQRTIGNQAVGRLINSGALRAKLRIGQPGDIYEQEADRVAEQVMRMPEQAVQPKPDCPFIKGSSRINSLRDGGQPLPESVRAFFEPRFGHDFSEVRVHLGGAAEHSARDVNANAYTVGHDIVFGEGRFAPGTQEGRRLISHELTHVVQQSSSDEMRVEHSNGKRGLSPITLGRTCLSIARQNKPASGQKASEVNKGDESQPKDTMAGTLVSEIIVSVSRKRVGFRSVVGMILGDIDTDLKPGKYELKPDTDHQKWIIVKPSVKTGLRFSVDLEGANPWTLKYPDILPLTVTVGSLVEPKVYGDMFDAEGNLIDPLWLHEGMPPEMKPKPVAGIDDFESTRYDLDYRSEKGNLSKWLVVSYRDDTSKDINLDTITQTTPRLWMAKQEALKIMDDYNTMFILGTFPTVFFIITISPTVSVPRGDAARYTPNRRSFPKQEPMSKQEPVPKQEPGPTPKVNEPKSPPVIVASPLIKPVNGKVNVGGGLEPGSEGATNLNPIKSGSGGPSKGIPNHVKAGFEEIGEVFEPGSVKEIFSNRLRYGDVNWTKAAQGSAKVVAKGGKLSLNVWTQSAKETQIIIDAFTSAGFKDVRALGEGTGTIIIGRW